MERSQLRRRARLRRHRRVRRKVVGLNGRPRLSVFRSARHIYAQIIDDVRGRTLVAASTLEPELRQRAGGLKGAEQAHRVGQLLAQRASAAGVQQVVLDRGGYLYHGRVRALAEGARQAGLRF
ncbi:MAG: 50S ribosomal protein L18 [Chloroflexi bacterium]|nr:50S ribosomal protein L18 [Chloroflexota bacterium]